MSDDDSTPNEIEFHHWLCPDCGKHHKFPDGGNVKQCVECSALLVRMNGLDVTPNEELRALVEELEKVSYNRHKEGYTEQAYAYHNAATALLRVIEE